MTTECIRTRFNQKDPKVYQSIQKLLLKAVAGEDLVEELAKVMAVYEDTDLQQYKLEAQLPLLPLRSSAGNGVRHLPIRHR